MAKVAIVSHSIVDERHNVECNVYDLFRGTEGSSVPTVWYTQQISKDSIGVILMDDLSPDNVCIGLMASLNSQQVGYPATIITAQYSFTKALVSVCPPINVSAPRRL